MATFEIPTLPNYTWNELEFPAGSNHERTWAVGPTKGEGSRYSVTLKNDGEVTCTCKGYEYRETCKHSTVLLDFLMEQDEEKKDEGNLLP